MNETPNVAKAGMRGWVRGLFILSLTLNLLVVGVVAGGMIGHAKRMPRAAIGEISMGPFNEAFSHEDREALRRAAEADGRDFREMRRAGRADFERLIAALRAEPWDEAEVRAAIEGHRARTIERMQIGERLMLGRLGAMQPEQRRAFADRLERGMRRAPVPKDKDTRPATDN